MEEIIKIKTKQLILKEKLKKEKKILHKTFFEENKKLFYFIDFIVVLCVVMNFGALTTTNYMTYKEAAIDEDKEIVIYEANPTMAERSNFKTVDDMAQELKLSTEELNAEKKQINMMWIILYQTAFFWAVLIFAYIFNRIRIYNHFQMGILIFVVAFYFSLLGYDFFHDLGFYLGKVLFG